MRLDKCHQKHGLVYTFQNHLKILKLKSIAAWIMRYVFNCRAKVGNSEVVSG